MSESKQVQKLLKMKRLIEEKKSLKNRLEGERDRIERQLKEQFNCNGERQAKTKLKSLASQIEEKEKTLNKELDRLENDFVWE
jgi:hypothetical protein